jgi:hypothetical protein
MPDEVKQTLVIERERWLRGEGHGRSQLLRKRDGKMCCLGFFGLACGLDASQLEGNGDPVDARSDKWPEWARENGPDISKLIVTNDDIGDLADRESSIASIFARHGVTVIFK